MAKTNSYLEIFNVSGLSKRSPDKTFQLGMYLLALYSYHSKKSSIFACTCCSKVLVEKSKTNRREERLELEKLYLTLCCTLITALHPYPINNNHAWALHRHYGGVTMTDYFTKKSLTFSDEKHLIFKTP